MAMNEFEAIEILGVKLYCQSQVERLKVEEATAVNTALDQIHSQ